MKSQQSTAVIAAANEHHALPDAANCDISEAAAPPHPLDVAWQNQVAKLTGGVSPTSVSLAWMDWFLNLANSPGKQMDLLKLLQQQAKNCLQPAPIGAADSRFADAGWSQWPYQAFSQAFLRTQDFWQAATSGVRGVSAHHEDVVSFTARQLLDMVAPSNFPWLNPEVLAATRSSGGKNLASGLLHMMQDLGLELPSQDGQAQTSTQLGYEPGREVALTPGNVVYRNHLIELIQYAPQTPTVHAQPLLIVPSWIMKYYILDLSPHNSMVAYLVSQGHTVFMISWRNPGQEDRQLGMQDYLRSGLFDALEQVAHICRQPVHTIGYCLGGTLLAIGAAAIAGKRISAPAQLASVTLLAAQTDFSEPGELGLFIDESQLAMLDALMWKQGYLDGKQMSGSFELLNSRDLIWSKLMREYQLGLRQEPNDLMSWNADTTRLPYRMHSEYLKHLFLHNDLAKGHYEVDHHVVALKDIKSPMYVVGTERDHVSPWRSVYKINVLADTEIEFVLASGGHNAGIVSEPGHARRSFLFLPTAMRSTAYHDPEAWLQQAQRQDGSWWEHWQQWLLQHSTAKRLKAVPLAAQPELGTAPGSYVFEK
ncbi:MULTISPECIES: PHA/PHB synthase family protein [unclassified Undibacterium]|uniref:PHA/PHB synthase family protein n=1 Tax=unclassified Undibacterium TaxID=2630295 RepID=UPI002AC9AD5F|nr:MULTISPECIES: alpha/beta fold hydrolase [unclassified Undibacterium]MEB0137590.1 alpha/beta fold hydrolase [Undibacterium sp. CCC2.1]MEB0170591.1 alpha/beta fold hydrolase [Undibacterium sp. CCC1.1]MEB0174532.1 alpha/beta fold hydrolase [Undibacterium sp. CCC3.4]MEB0213671.1 alpha/beta fold hydrolase [Undibacterium sp. 5I2]WPX43837.1 alpha/beta fold hydrolase [Undibacterium sp. CCC3.4]